MLLKWSLWNKTKQPHNQKSKNTTEKLIHMGLTALSPWTMGVSWECVVHINYPVYQTRQQTRNYCPGERWMCPLHLPILSCSFAFHQLASGEPLPYLTGSLTSGPLCHTLPGLLHRNTNWGFPVEVGRGEEWREFETKKSRSSTTQGHVSESVVSGGFVWMSPEIQRWIHRQQWGAFNIRRRKF